MPSQDSLTNQMQRTIEAAVAAGDYDAVDWIRDSWNRSRPPKSPHPGMQRTEPRPEATTIAELRQLIVRLQHDLTWERTQRRTRAEQAAESAEVAKHTPKTLYPMSSQWACDVCAECGENWPCATAQQELPPRPSEASVGGGTRTGRFEASKPNLSQSEADQADCEWCHGNQDLCTRRECEK